MNPILKKGLQALGVTVALAAMTYLGNFLKEEKQSNHGPFYETDYLPNKIETVNRLTTNEKNINDNTNKLLDILKQMAKERNDRALMKAIDSAKRELKLQAARHQQAQRIYQTWKGVSLWRDRTTGTVTYFDPYELEHRPTEHVVKDDINWYFYLDKHSGRKMRCLTDEQIQTLKDEGEL